MTDLQDRAERLLAWTRRNPDHPLCGRDLTYFLSGHNDRTDPCTSSGSGDSQ